MIHCHYRDKSIAQKVKKMQNEYPANLKYITEVLDPVEIYVECFLDLVNNSI